MLVSIVEESAINEPICCSLDLPIGGKTILFVFAKHLLKKSTIDEKMIGEVTAYLCTVGLFIGSLGGA